MLVNLTDRLESQHRSRRWTWKVVLAGLLLVLPGCATFRGMPTHGGGKRFDEEQRLVSATIRHATAKMDLTRLRKSKIALEVTALPTTGNSREFSYDLTNFGGLESVYGYRLKPRLDANRNITRQDIEYLEKALTQELRLSGYQVTSPKDAELYLIVLVDALGTNYIRRDYGIAFRDNLGASCEMTYYAVDARTQKMVSTARSVASVGDYCELNIRFTPFSFNATNLTDFTERMAPVPGKRDLASGPWEKAHIDDLQFKLKQQPGKRAGQGGRAPSFKLPDGDPMGPDGQLLPPIPDAPGAETRAEKMKRLIKEGFTAARNKNAEELEAVIKEIRATKPEAPVIEKLETRLKALREKEPPQRQRAGEGGADDTVLLDDPWLGPVPAPITIPGFNPVPVFAYRPVRGAQTVAQIHITTRPKPGYLDLPVR